MTALAPDAPLSAALLALESWCKEAGLPFDRAWGAPIEQLGRTLALAQARTNLVGDARPAALCEHIVEALTVAAVAQLSLSGVPRSAVDVGAGAGLEAWTLALCWPQARVVAVEPRKLRAAFIEQAALATGVANLRVIPATLASCGVTADFDVATARAVWPAAEWLARSRNLLAPRGVTAVHGSAPAILLADSIASPAWKARGARDVPGARRHAIAVFAPVGGAP